MTSEQLSLTNVRASDPDTSHAAAAVPREGMKWKVLELFRASDRWQQDGGFTDEDLERRYRRAFPDGKPPGRGSVGKRRQELVELGLVEDSGERRPTETGCTAIVWRLR